MTRFATRALARASLCLFAYSTLVLAREVTLTGPPGNEQIGVSRKAHVGWAIYNGATGRLEGGLP